jgi:hypothetical protein
VAPAIDFLLKIPFAIRMLILLCTVSAVCIPTTMFILSNPWPSTVIFVASIVLANSLAFWAKQFFTWRAQAHTLQIGNEFINLGLGMMQAVIPSIMQTLSAKQGAPRFANYVGASTATATSTASAATSTTSVPAPAASTAPATSTASAAASTAPAAEAHAPTAFFASTKTGTRAAIARADGNDTDEEFDRSESPIASILLSLKTQ